MTVYSFAELPRWAAKVEKIADAVVSQSANDMLASIKIAPGITRGGSRQRGTIPRDLGALAASLQSSLYGGTAMSGAASFVLVAGQMKAGDVATFAWGGTVAPYARHVHYGANGVPGTFWIDVAAAGWPGFVKGAVRKAKAEIQ
jgi:hypothetical protein